MTLISNEFMLLCSLILTTLSSTSDDYSLSYKNEGIVLIRGKGRTIYVLKNQIRQKVPNPKTLFYLEEDLGSPIFLNEEALNSIPVGDAFPSWEPRRRINRKKNSEFISNYKKISNSIINPSFAHWNGKYITCFRHAAAGTTNLMHVDAFKYTIDRMSCQFLNSSLDLIGPIIPIVYKHSPHIFVIGEDPRLHITENNKLYITFNRINITISTHRRIYLSEITTQDGTMKNIFLLEKEMNLNYEHESGPRDQKNWMPFSYQHRILLIYNILPHHRILHTIPTKQSDTMRAETISVSHCINASWDFGEPRGGSCPVRIGSDRYLSFFHSSTRGYSSKWWATSYFMGVYTFSATPPFTIHAISREPIILKEFYTGEWTSSHTDYVSFPTNVVVQGNNLWLACGRQDRDAWMIRMDLKKLLASLQPLDCKAMGHPRWQSLE